MPRPTPLVSCSESDWRELERQAASRSDEARLVERARSILGCLNGKQVKQIAHEVGICANTVMAWPSAFSGRAAGLRDRSRGGCPMRYGPEIRKKVLERAAGYVQTTDGRIVRGFKSAYKRHGPLNLFAALEVASGPPLRSSSWAISAGK